MTKIAQNLKLDNFHNLDLDQVLMSKLILNGLESAYLTGSNTNRFFSTTSDLDIVFIWNNSLPKLDLRNEILNSLTPGLGEIILDSPGNELRDAKKPTEKSNRKIECYHYTMFGAIVLLEQALERLSFDDLVLLSHLKYRISLFESEFGNYLNLVINNELQHENLIHKLNEKINLKIDRKIDGQSPVGQKYTNNATKFEMDQAELISAMRMLRIDGRVFSKKHWDKISYLKYGSCPESLSNGQITIQKADPKFSIETFDIIDKQRERIGTFLSWVKNINSIEDQKMFYSKAHSQWQNQEVFHFQVMVSQNGQANLVGGISIHTIDFSQGSFQLGFWIDEKFQGRGLVSKAVDLILSEMKKNNWKQALIKARGDNVRSISVARRLGFTLIDSLPAASMDSLTGASRAQDFVYYAKDLSW